MGNYMKDVEQFVKYYCGYLTHEQETVMLAKIKEGRVIGVARPIGQMKLCPLVSFDPQLPSVIDGAGYYQLASSDGMMVYTRQAQDEYMTAYYQGRNRSGLSALFK